MNDDGKKFRIATWNMDHWKRSVQQRQDAWEFLRTGDIADVALLQECVPPANLQKTHLEYREIGASRPWGSAVVSFSDNIQIDEIGTVRSRYSTTKFSMLGTYPGSIIVTRAKIPDVAPVTCISVYGLINVYAQTTVLRIIADLIPLFDSPDGQNVILGGDFNLTTATNPLDAEFPRYKAILAAVESLGLKNVALTAKQKPQPIQGCLCGQENCQHLHTYGDSPGTQLDWLFASPALARRCESIRVEHDITAEWSDHSPIIAEFNLPVNIDNKMWEPESITKELGIRHGRSAQRTTEELLSWAYRKHEELTHDYKSSSLNRLPTSTGTDPEIWVQLDMKRPEGLQ